MELYRLTFKPMSPFTCKIESYTLFGAICWGYKILFGEKVLLDLLESFKEKPPFLISSPVLKHNEKLFFPCPQMPDEFPEPENYKNYQFFKKIKKGLSLIPEEIFIEFLQQKFETKYQLSEKVKEFLFKNNNYPQDIPVNIPHNSINRLTWTTVGGQLFNITSFYYPEFCVFVNLMDKNFDLEILKKLLELVSIGGDKSIGLGRVKVLEIKRDKVLEKYLSPEKDKSEKFYTLSPSLQDEVYDYKKSYYQIFLYAGIVDNFYERLTTPILKKRHIYFKTSSVFVVKHVKTCYGKFPPVLAGKNKNKEVTIYQYGYAFPLYIKNKV